MIQTTLVPGVAWPEYKRTSPVRRDLNADAIHTKYISAIKMGAVTSNALSAELGRNAAYVSKRLRMMEKLGMVAREQIPRKDGVTEYKWRVV